MCPAIEMIVQPQGKVLQEYADCRAEVSMIMGPLGSGKTVQSILKIFDLMCEQEPVKIIGHKNYNKRLTRFIAARNTYSELFSTTIKDYREIMDEFGVFKMGSKEPPCHSVEFKLDDGTTVQSEVIFIAFDRPDHVKKARGIQATWVWLNETKEHSKAVVDILHLRTGRYPSNKEGVACTQYGMIGDTNAPDEDHWYYELAEENTPEGWKFHRQPGGLKKAGEEWVINEGAENIQNLPGGYNYYLKGKQGKKGDWIKVNLANEYGFVIDGKPVHPLYVDSVHCQSFDFTPSKDIHITLGFDFGRTPACVFAQKVPPYNRWVVFDEFCADDMSAISFAPNLKKYLESEYPGYKFRGWGDPSGDSEGQATDDTPFKIIRGAGIPCTPTVTNKSAFRRAALEEPMKELCMDGKPRFVILPKAKMVRKGLQGGFCYRRIMVSGEKYTDEPDKNQYSHPVEACEYALQGEGEGRSIVKLPGSPTNTQAVQMKTGFNVFD